MREKVSNTRTQDKRSKMYDYNNYTWPTVLIHKCQQCFKNHSHEQD